jgi:hypothetical protein
VSEEKAQQKPQETAKAHAAFLEYCAMGPERSLRKLAEKQGKNRAKTGQIANQLAIWSAQHHWQERVKKYDAEQIAPLRREAAELAYKKLKEHLNEKVDVTPATQIKAIQIAIQSDIQAELDEKEAENAVLRKELEDINALLVELGLQK